MDKPSKEIRKEFKLIYKKVCLDCERLEQAGLYEPDSRSGEGLRDMLHRSIGIYVCNVADADQKGKQGDLMRSLPIYCTFKEIEQKVLENGASAEEAEYPISLLKLLFILLCSFHRFLIE